MDNNNKRPFDDDNEYHSESTKKHKVIHDLSTSDSKSTKEIVGLQNLCDDMIMHIFKYLTHSDLAMMPQ